MSQIRKEKEQEGKEKKEEEVVTLTGMCDKYLAELPPAMSKSSRIAAAIRHGTLVVSLSVYCFCPVNSFRRWRINN